MLMEKFVKLDLKEEIHFIDFFEQSSEFTSEQRKLIISQLAKPKGQEVLQQFLCLICCDDRIFLSNFLFSILGVIILSMIYLPLACLPYV